MMKNLVRALVFCIVVSQGTSTFGADKVTSMQNATCNLVAGCCVKSESACTTCGEMGNLIEEQRAFCCGSRPADFIETLFLKSSCERNPEIFLCFALSNLPIAPCFLWIPLQCRLICPICYWANVIDRQYGNPVLSKYNLVIKPVATICAEWCRKRAGISEHYIH